VPATDARSFGDYVNVKVSEATYFDLRGFIVS